MGIESKSGEEAEEDISGGVLGFLIGWRSVVAVLEIGSIRTADTGEIMPGKCRQVVARGGFCYQTVEREKEKDR